LEDSASRNISWFDPVLSAFLVVMFIAQALLFFCRRIIQTALVACSEPFCRIFMLLCWHCDVSPFRLRRHSTVFGNIIIRVLLISMYRRIPPSFGGFGCG
jgi:hypothetical protein